jgi:hypothetical protein
MLTKYFIFSVNCDIIVSHEIIWISFRDKSLKRLFYYHLTASTSYQTGLQRWVCWTYKGWFRLLISITKISHQSDFKLDNRPLKIGQVFTHKTVLLIHCSIIFSKLGACAETISPKIQIKIKFKQIYVYKNPIFILDYNQIANSCELQAWAR